MTERTMDLSTAAETIESLINLELRPPGPTYGVIRRLYESAREVQGGFPTELAVRALTSRVKPGDVVIILTGAYVPNYLPRGETDGPTGAASIAYGLHLGLGAVPVILSEGTITGPVSASCLAIGLGTLPLEIAREVPYTVAVDSFPADDTAEARAQELIRTLRPAAVIAIEKLGVNAVGQSHTATGLPLNEGRARGEVLINAAREAGILTIGIGDNGNEIGMGTIFEAVREHKPYGRVCRCPCGEGLACATACDVLITAAVSNWGGYGLTACLAVATRKPELLHDGATERRMVEACVAAGAADGSTGRYIPDVDGVPGAINSHLVDMLGLIVAKNLTVRMARKF